MTKRLAFTKSQLNIAAEIARKHGVRVRLEADGAITFEPASVSTNGEDDLDAEWAAYEARNGGG